MIRFLAFLAMLAYVSGCAPVAVPWNSPFDKYNLGELRGLPASDVEARLGAPSHEFRQDEERHFIYRGISDSVQAVILFLYPVPWMNGKQDTLVCLRLTFDKDNKLRRYDTQSRNRIWTSGATELSCPSLFWSEEELFSMEFVRNDWVD
jgi:hypothetical protein